MSDKIHRNVVVKTCENIIFNVKWGLMLFYIGLIVVFGVYAYTFILDIIGIIRGTNHTMEGMKIIILDFIDVVMVANLTKMIIAGSYHSFVSKEHQRKNEEVSSGVLKTKISTSIIVLAMINILKTFIAASEHHVEMIVVYQQLMMFGAFLVGACVLGALEYLHIKGEKIEHDIHHNDKKKDDSHE